MIFFDGSENLVPAAVLLTPFELVDPLLEPNQVSGLYQTYEELFDVWGIV